MAAFIRAGQGVTVLTQLTTEKDYVRVTVRCLEIRCEGQLHLFWTVTLPGMDTTVSAATMRETLRLLYESCCNYGSMLSDFASAQGEDNLPVKAAAHWRYIQTRSDCNSDFLHKLEALLIWLLDLCDIPT